MTMTTDTIFVSVIIPCLNDYNRLIKCLGMLEKQTYPADAYEVIVVDNGASFKPYPGLSEFPHAKLIYEPRGGSYAARNLSPSRPLPGNVRYVAGDFGSKHFLMDVLQGVDEIIHLAYLTVPKTSFDDPVQDILNNLPGTVVLLEAADHMDVKKFVFVSSGGTVYGKGGNAPIQEDHPTNPISPYGISKLTAEKYAKMFYEIKSLPVVCVRPANWTYLRRPQ